MGNTIKLFDNVGDIPDCFSKMKSYNDFFKDGHRFSIFQYISSIRVQLFTFGREYDMEKEPKAFGWVSWCY